MKRFSKSQFSKFDDSAYRTLHQLDPTRFAVSREKIGDSVIYQLVDTITGILCLKYMLVWNSDGSVQHSMWSHEDYRDEHDQISESLNAAIKGTLPKFVSYTELADFKDSFRKLHAIFLGTLPDAVNLVRSVIIASTHSRLQLTERMLDEGEGLALLGFSTRQEYERWQSESDSSSPPAIVGFAHVRRLNEQRSQIVIYAITSTIDKYLQDIAKNLDQPGVTESIQLGAEALDWVEQDPDYDTITNHIPVVQRVVPKAAAPSEVSLKYRYLATLNQKIASKFSRSDIDHLCLELGVNHEEIRGETPSEKARELTAYANRRDKLEELISLCEKERPNMDWRN